MEESYDIDDLSNNINGFRCNGTPLPSKTTNGYKLAKGLNDVETSVSILKNLRELGSVLSSYGAEKG